MRKNSFLCLFAIAALAAIFFSPSLQGGIEIPKLHENAFNSHNACGVCHVDIHNHWEQSMHARSYSDPVFYLAYLRAYHETQGQAKKDCLRCHAPTVLATGDFDVKEQITKEGVTCDFCHSVKALKGNDDNIEYELNISGAKYGPYTEGDFIGHRTEQSSFITSARFCAGCHELKGKNGVQILSTYTEWKDGPLSATGVQCQDCHMQLGEGNVVTPLLQKSKNVINYHDVKGKHQSQLRKAAKVEIGEMKLERDRLIVSIGVTNDNAGHKIPTGDPSRALVLKVNVLNSDSHILFTKEEVFRKTLVDEEGNQLFESVDIFLKAAAVLQDNRISPGETYFTTMTFDVDDSEGITVEAKLFYWYRSEYQDYSEMFMEMAGDRKSL